MCLRKKWVIGPGQVAQLVGASSQYAKCYQFDPQSGYMQGLAKECRNRQNSRLLSLSFFLFP